LPDRVEPGRDDGIHCPFPVRKGVPESESRPLPGLVDAQPARSFLVLEKRQVAVEFLTDLIVEARPAHDIPEPSKY
jgi:hypothetical protein